MKINQVLESMTPSSSTANTGGGQAPTFGRSDKFLEDELKETTSSGAIATVAAPIGKMQKRGGGSMFKGIKTSKKFVNSPVSEADISENDLIIVPGQMSKRSRGFIPHGTSRVDHEVEMAKSDLVQCVKNSKQIYRLIKDLSEQEGLEGWVQEKITKAEDYLNTVREYLEGKYQQVELDELSKNTLKSYFPKRVKKAKEIARTEFDKAERITTKDLPRAMRKLKDPEYDKQQSVSEGSFKQTPGQQQYGALHSRLQSLANSGQINTPDGKQKAEKMIDTIQQLVDTDPSCAGSTVPSKKIWLSAQGVSEGSDDVDITNNIKALSREFDKTVKHFDRMDRDPAYAKKWNKRYAKYPVTKHDSYGNHPDDDTAALEEGAVKTLSMDLQSMSDKEFFAKYKKTKIEARAGLKGLSEERTETKNEKGEVTSWKDESDWHKGSKNKDGRGKVANLSDNARRETEKLGKEEDVTEESKGLWANIHAKRERGERMRKPGSKGAPTKDAFKKAAK